MVFSLMLIGSLGVSGDSCVVKADCEAALQCLAGECTARPQAGGACRRSADCATGLRCRANACVAPGTSAASAPSPAPSPYPVMLPPPPPPEPAQRAPSAYAPEPPLQPWLSHAPPAFALKPPGWSLAGSIIGLVSVLPIVTLSVYAAIASGPSATTYAIAYGTSAMTMFAVVSPLVAASGASVRRGLPGVSGVFALRLVSWIGYGLTLADASVLIGLGIGGADVPGGAIAGAALLGVGTIVCFVVDALISRGQAKRVLRQQQASSLQFAPSFRLAKTRDGGVVPTFGLAASF